MTSTGKRDTTYKIEEPSDVAPLEDSPSDHAPEKLFPHNPE
jgi:hypothetical protein